MKDKGQRLKSRESVHRSEMKVVEVARDAYRGSVIDKALYAGVDFTMTVDAVPGRPQLINIFIRNPYGY
jgi:hypothetical protein